MPSARLALAALVVLGSGCSLGAGRPGGDRSAVYVPEARTVDLDAVGVVTPDTTALDVFVRLPERAPTSLRDAEGGFHTVRTTIVVRASSGVVATRTRTDSVRAGAERPEVRRERLAAPPGAYLVEATVEDDATGERLVRRLSASVPDPGGPPTVGRLRFETSTEGGRFELVVADEVRAGDSLRVVAQGVGWLPGTLPRVAVVRLTADTTAAAPPFSAPAPGVGLQSVDLDGSGDTLYVARLGPVGRGAAADLTASIPALSSGVYRVTLALKAAQEASTMGASSRLLIVRRRDYPRLTRVGDLIAPLVYLARPPEWAALTASPSPTAQKRALDRFWGEQMDDRRRAAAAFRVYYDRVEQANRQFTTQKEGWKTDRGLLYAVFGPPTSVDRRFQTETWTYTGASIGALTFVFERGQDPDALPFDVYTLVRTPAYDGVWRRAIASWRRGDVP